MTTPGTEVDLYRPVGGEDGLSGLDTRLLEFAAQRMSPEQMAEELSLRGVTPARAAQRVKEILRSQDWLSIAEQKGLILLDIVKLRDLIYDRIEGAETRITRNGEVVEVESDAKHFSNMIRLLKEWRELIQSLQLDVDADKIKIRASHAKAMGRAIEKSFTGYNEQLSLLGYHIPPEVARQAMEEALPRAFESLQADTA